MNVTGTAGGPISHVGPANKERDDHGHGRVPLPGQHRAQDHAALSPHRHRSVGLAFFTFATRRNLKSAPFASINSISESFAVIPGGTSERFVQLGSELRLRCKISKTVRAGESPPRISWFRNGTRLSAYGGGGAGKVVVSPVNYKRVSALHEIVHKMNVLN